MTIADVPRIDSAATHVGALRRHFADLRDRSHGEAAGRQAKEEVFKTTVPLLRPYAVQALEEINEGLLLGKGTVPDSGLRPRRCRRVTRRCAEDDSMALFELSTGRTGGLQISTFQELLPLEDRAEVDGFGRDSDPG